MKHKFENIWKKKEEKLKEWNKFEIKYKFENIEIQQRLKVFIYLDYLNLINSLKKKLKKNLNFKWTKIKNSQNNHENERKTKII